MREILWSCLGTLLGIATVVGLSSIAGTPFLAAPLGATCLLLFAVPESPLAQPRNVVGGHALGTLSGLLFAQFGAPDLVLLALACAAALGAMQMTRTLHPPAGAVPLLILTVDRDWPFLWMQIVPGAVALVLLALVVNRLARRAYPSYWL